MPLKPRQRLRRLALGLQQVIHVLAEGRIGQHAFELVPRHRLQDNPGVLREFPQRRITPPPQFVGAHRFGEAGRIRLAQLGQAARPVFQLEAAGRILRPSILPVEQPPLSYRSLLRRYPILEPRPRQHSAQCEPAGGTQLRLEGA